MSFLFSVIPLIPWPQGTQDSVLAVYISDLLFAYTRGEKLATEKINSDISLIYYYVMGPALVAGEIGNYWTNATDFPTPSMFIPLTTKIKSERKKLIYCCRIHPSLFKCRRKLNYIASIC
jgi:hypothetical protein